MGFVLRLPQCAFVHIKRAWAFYCRLLFSRPKTQGFYERLVSLLPKPPGYAVSSFVCRTASVLAVPWVTGPPEGFGQGAAFFLEHGEYGVWEGTHFWGGSPAPGLPWASTASVRASARDLPPNPAGSTQLRPAGWSQACPLPFRNGAQKSPVTIFGLAALPFLELTLEGRIFIFHILLFLNGRGFFFFLFFFLLVK